MPKVSRAHKEARRQQILDAALNCFARKGYQNTSMADIVEASGMSAGAIYVYFAGKREILAGVAHAFVDRRLKVLRETGEGEVPKSPVELVRSVGAINVESATHNLTLQLWSMAATEPEVRKIIRDSVVEARTAIEETLVAWARLHPEGLGEGLEPESWARTLAPAVLGLIQGLTLQGIAGEVEPYLEAVSLLLD